MLAGSAEADLTVFDDVKDFIVRKSPKAVCDDCITANLRLSVRQHATHKTRELAKLRGFDRCKDTCSICGTRKKVIRYGFVA